MTNGRRNRNAGHNWERQLARMFQQVGFPHVVTARSESKSRDDQKVDLINRDEAKHGRFPFNVQAKCTTTSLPYPKVLDEMPTDRGVINVILHKQTGKTETGRFVPRGKYAILHMDDFMFLLKQIYDKRIDRRRVVRTTQGGVDQGLHGPAQEESDQGL